jgi:hypothetical protein
MEETVKKLLLFSVAFLILACQDSGPVQPDSGTTAELAVVQANGPPTSLMKLVPFKGHGVWWPAEEGDASPCAQFPGASPMFIEWEGNATQLGLNTGTATNCMGPGQVPNRPFLSQSFKMVAANGDILLGFGSAAEDGAGLILYPDLSFEVGPVPFVGGTGRFDGATGWYRVKAENMLGGPFTMEGEISTVGSNK